MIPTPPNCNIGAKPGCSSRTKPEAAKRDSYGKAKEPQVATGSHIGAVAGGDIKRLTLELGGKSAALVFPDAPSVARAAEYIMGSCSTFLSGQVCSTQSRALVHRSVYDEFVEAARNQLGKVRQGDPFDMATTSAALIDKRQMERVLGYIDIGRQENARLVAGGGRPDSPALAAGNWVSPALFADADNTMQIAREEIFGPVLTVIPFTDEEEAVRIANDSNFGLSGGVYTGNIARAWRIGKALRTGSVGINGYGVMPNSPAGGFKQSGLGREGGIHGIEAFTEVKTLMFNLDG